MKLAILGGGGFRVPLVFGALLGDLGQRRVETVMLHDTDETRLSAIERVLAQQADQARAQRHPGSSWEAPRVLTTTSLDAALDGADFVFSAMRVGGLEGRTADERVALDLGLLGLCQPGQGVEDSVVLDRRRQDADPTRVSIAAGPEDSLERQVVRLGATGGENDVCGPTTQRSGDRLARLLDDPAGMPA